MKLKIVTMAALVALSIAACGKIDTDVDDAASTIAGAIDGIDDQIESTIDGILQDHQDQDSDDSAADDADTVNIEDNTGQEFIAAYSQVASTCDDRYDLPQTVKLFAAIDESGNFASDVILTDLAGDWDAAGTVDTDTQMIRLAITGSSALDVLSCSCEFDAVGFTCHCESDDGSCATVYNIN